MTNTSDIKTNVPSAGLITDLHENLIGEKIWTSARNAVLNSHLGQVQFLQNEPSNIKCVDFPLTPIGFIRLLRNRWAVFMTDNRESEIGIFNEHECTYSKLVNSKCLNFNTDSLVKGESKEMADCSETIYWTDGRRNPRRHLNLSNIPYKYTFEDDTCKTKVYSDDFDCDSILIDKKISVPLITTVNTAGGILRNGAYEFAIAYTINKSRVTDFYSLTSPRYIWSHENFGKAIDLTISDLDRDYEQYELVMISTINGATSYKTVGWFSTATTFHHISTDDRVEYEPITLEEIIVKRTKFPYADNVESNDQYLLWSGTQTNPELNYQLQAMGIKSNFVVYQVPADYYKKGGNLKGYARDETYSFAIQWLYENGEWSDAFHIPGKKGRGVELGIASGRDVYETTMRTQMGLEPTVIRRYEVENTAGSMRRVTSKQTPEERVIGRGEMGLWMSTVKYGDDVNKYGEDACTPIRHHIFPDECKAPRYGGAGTYLHILGIEFSGIEHPKDSKGQPVKGIVGYRIVRGNRRGNKRVLAKGIVTNVRSYVDNNQEVLYTNYGFNDLRPDSFLSSKQTFNKAGGERDFIPVTGFKNDQFNFYSPDTQFNHISLGNELAIYTDETSQVEGFFEHVYQQPKFKLLTEADLYFALIIGAIDGYLSTRGKKTYIRPKKALPGAPYEVRVITGVNGGTDTLNSDNRVYEEVTDSVINGINDPSLTALPAKFLVKALQTIAKVGMFAFFALEAAKNVLDVISNASPWEDYALQYNAHGLFNMATCVDKDYRRRYIQHYQYIFDGVNTVLGLQYNNFKREESVYLKLNDELSISPVIDNTRRTLSEFGLCNDISRKVQSQASIKYVSVKRSLPNQYGQLDGIQYLDTGTINKIVTPEDTYQTPPIFGGDMYIGRMTTKRTHNYFANTITNVENGFVYDYRTFRNVAYPRYWLDSSPYDISEFISIAPKLSNTPKNKHNLDCGVNTALNIVRNRYFYTSNNAVIDYFVESEINVDYRDYKGEEQNFYSSTNSNLSYLFRSDKVTRREEFVYDETYSKELMENYIPPQREDFDPTISSECLQYDKNRIIYSLPAFKEQKGDNWLVYLAENQYTFSLSKFGELTGMHGVDNQQIMFLFDKSSPYITIGRDELQTTGGKTITLGDGGLFAREPRPIAYTDHHYGACQSGHAFINTQFGSFYPSQAQGRIFSYRGQLEEITQSGMSYWFKNYLPSMLLRDFPTYQGKDNPISGVGLTSTFDNIDEKYYISKKDYLLRTSMKGKVTYNEVKNKFYSGSSEVKLTNTNYFIDTSWTISYDPKSKVFVSWHDWHPDYYLPTDSHFMTLKGNTLWKHNTTTGSFCNFYGIDYPFQIEYLVNNGQNNEILRSIEYLLEVGKYFNDGRDFHMILDENFDYLTVHNNEQMSGPLKLFLQSKKDMSQQFNFPRIDVANQKIDIVYNKEEQKYRINQFTDLVKDRGEFTHKNLPLWYTSPNGYVKEINMQAIDLGKAPQHQKKFRNVWHKVLLTKTVSGENKFIFKFANSKETNSFR